jgi:hypothetical protein
MPRLSEKRKLEKLQYLIRRWQDHEEAVLWAASGKKPVRKPDPRPLECRGMLELAFWDEALAYDMMEEKEKRAEEAREAVWQAEDKKRMEARWAREQEMEMIAYKACITAQARAAAKDPPLYDEEGMVRGGKTLPWPKFVLEKRGY